MGEFWPKSKAIALVFCRILTENQFEILERKVAKMGEFWPKSKAIALVFCRILTENQFD